MKELIERTAKSLISSNYAIAMTGAGISTESNIPDYRGAEGIWTKNPDAEKRAYDAYQIFANDPLRYWNEGYGTHILEEFFKKAIPNKGHIALANLQDRGIIKTIITQNIDMLHARAGTKKLIEYHGNALRLRCTNCNSRYPKGDYDMQISMGSAPKCIKCGMILKSDIVNFGEPIPNDVIQGSLKEVLKSDCILICGTSASVHPFASLPYIARDRKGTKINIIEINKSPTPLTDAGVSDFLITGNIGKILPRIIDAIDYYSAL